MKENLKHQASFCKRFTSVILLLALIITLLPACSKQVAENAQTSGDNIPFSKTDNSTKIDPSTPFIPTLRFVVTSDIHIRDTENNYQSHERLIQFCNSAYAYADSQVNYTKLDGMFFVGDITNNGGQNEYSLFFNYVKDHTRTGTVTQAVLGNHEFFDTGMFDSASMINTPIRFMEQSGDAAVDTHQVIGGYHFITMSMDIYNTFFRLYYSASKLNWLKKELNQAVTEDPNKPIFLFQHIPPADTVIGSYGADGDKALKELLSHYPQVINFSGHTHCSLSNPRSIWQSSFTALNTGSLAYLSLPIPNYNRYSDGGVCATDAEGNWSTTPTMRDGIMYYIVETDQYNRVRIQIYDMINQKVWGEPYLIDTFNPADFPYTDARKDFADKPSFSNALSPSCDVTDQVATITFPQAASKDIVQSYRVELYQGSSRIETVYRLACTNYGYSTPETIRATFTDLTPATTYIVKVYAVNSWAKESDPLLLQFTTNATGSG